MKKCTSTRKGIGQHDGKDKEIANVNSPHLAAAVCDGMAPKDGDGYNGYSGKKGKIKNAF